MSQSHHDPTLESFLDSLLSHLQNRDHQDCLALLRVVRMRGLKDPISQALVDSFSSLPADDDYRQAISWVKDQLKGTSTPDSSPPADDPFADLDLISVSDDLDELDSLDDDLALIDVDDDAFDELDEFDESDFFGAFNFDEESHDEDESEAPDANLIDGNDGNDEDDEISAGSPFDFEFDDLEDISQSSGFRPGETFDGQDRTKQFDPTQLQALSSGFSGSDSNAEADPASSAEFADAFRFESEASDPGTPVPSDIAPSDITPSDIAPNDIHNHPTRSAFSVESLLNPDSLASQESNHDLDPGSAPSFDSGNWPLSEDSLGQEASVPSLDETSDPSSFDSEHFDFALGPEPSMPIDQSYGSSTPTPGNDESEDDASLDLDFSFDPSTSQSPAEPSSSGPSPQITSDDEDDEDDFDFDLGFTSPAPASQAQSPAPPEQPSSPVASTDDADDDFDFDFGFSAPEQAPKEPFEDMPYAEPEGDFFPPPLNSSSAPSPAVEPTSSEDDFFSPSPVQPTSLSAPGVPDYAPVEDDSFFPPPLNSQQPEPEPAPLREPATRQAFPTAELKAPEASAQKEAPTHKMTALPREPSSPSGPRALIDEPTPAHGTTPLPSPPESSFSPLDEDELLALGEGLSHSGSSAFPDDSDAPPQRYRGEPLVRELGDEATPSQESPLDRSLQRPSEQTNPFADQIPTGVGSESGMQSSSFILEELHRPPSEVVDTPEAAIAATLTEARSLYEDAHFQDAIELIDAVLEVDPSSQEAKDLRSTVINELERTLKLQLGALSQTPQLVVAMNDIANLDLDHRAGFLLSQIDGFLTIEDILDMSAMSNLETLTLLVDLSEQDIIKLS